MMIYMPLCYLWSLQVTLSIYNIYPELEIAAWPGLSTVSTVFSSPIHLYLYTYLYHFPASVVLILVQHYNCCTICSNITLTQSRRQADKSKESRSNCESSIAILPHPRQSDTVRTTSSILKWFLHWISSTSEVGQVMVRWIGLPPSHSQ
jgi:hypothetical protein